MRTLESFIADHQAKVESLEIAAALAYWDATLTGTQEDEQKAATLLSELLTKYSDPDDLEFLVSHEAMNDPDVTRQQKLLIDLFLAHQSSKELIAELASREMEIETTFSNFRAELNGQFATENQLKKVLKSSDDVEDRLNAWRASKQIGAQVEPKVIALVKLRNQEARRLGYDNYYSMRITLQEMDESWLFSLLEDVAERLTPAFALFKESLDRQLCERFDTTPDLLRPWHYSDPFFQSAPDAPQSSLDAYFEGRNLEEIAVRFFAAIGFDIVPLLRRSDLYEKPGKMQHAYCTAIGRGTHDVRVLCNLVSNSDWMATLLHEFGHAVYDDLIDETLPFFLRTVTHTMTTEAIAELMGRFVDNGEWLRKYVGINDSDVHKISDEASKAHRAHLLIFTQWVLVMATFERELYRNTDRDLDDLWWTIVEKYQRVRRPDFPLKGVWASKIHLATVPVYYHNYLLGEMTASQILATLRGHVVSTEEELISSPRVGEWLTDNIFRPGARYSWNELLERATGEPLSPNEFVRELS